MPLSPAADSMPISAATLTDPKVLKRHFANGTSQNLASDPDPSLAIPRQSSEPPISIAEAFSFDSGSVPSKDDAYHMFDGKGLATNTTNTMGLSQASSSHLDPRQLLDPKGYKPAQLKKALDNTTVPDLSNGLQKRSLESGELQGMGSLIERVHNVSQREDRPRKRQKSEKSGGEDEDPKKIAFAGGGKGGEIGDYMKQKRKEGQSSLGPSSVVDLTRGRYSLIDY